MLRTRLWMGAVLIALTVGVLVVDQWLAPWYPFLFVLVMTLAGLACFELRGLLDPVSRPSSWLCFAAVLGRLIGKHPMAPVLSPKKTWEGAVGGMAAAVAAAVGINRFGPILNGIAAEVGFGITVGFAAMLGDLAESLIKRDCGRKDASQAV